jgi:hypothetical protein
VRSVRGDATLSVAEEPLQRGYDFRSSVLLEARGAALPAPAARPERVVPAKLVHYDANRVEIVADTPGPAVLVLADTYYPGWQAIVDGRAAPVLAANGLVRAVPLPDGGHVVEMRFRPPLALAEGLMSLGSIALLGLAWNAERSIRANIVRRSLNGRFSRCHASLTV